MITRGGSACSIVPCWVARWSKLMGPTGKIKVCCALVVRLWSGLRVAGGVLSVETV